MNLSDLNVLINHCNFDKLFYWERDPNLKHDAIVTQLMHISFHSVRLLLSRGSISQVYKFSETYNIMN